jgi:hypothetical protein
VEDLLHGAGLDHAPAVHHHDPVGHLGDDPEVVGDQDRAGVGLLLGSLEDLEDLRLDRHVERGGRLVGDQHLGLVGDRHRDHGALPHPARVLVGVAVEAVLGVGHAHELEQLDHPLAGVVVGHLLVVGRDRLGDLVADGQHRVQRGHRVLEDHGDLLAPDLAHRLLVEVEQVAPSSRISPAAIRPGGWGISPRTLITVTDLPEPDSPTTPRVSPG